MPTHLFQNITFSQRHLFGIVKGTNNIPTGHCRQTFDAIKVGVLDRHNLVLGKQGFRKVVNQLSIDKDVATVSNDLFDLVFHFSFLRLFDFRNLVQTVYLDTAAIDLDLVRVHAGVGQEDLAVFQPFGLANSDRLFQQESFFQITVSEGASRQFNDLHVIQIPASLQAFHGRDTQFGKMLLFRVDQLGRERRRRNLYQIVSGDILCGTSIERPFGHARRQSPSGADGLWMDPLLQEQVFGFTQQFSAQDGDRRGSVANLVVLDLAHVDQDFGCRIVQGDFGQNGGPIIGHRDRLIVRIDRLQDFVHAFGT